RRQPPTQLRSLPNGDHTSPLLHPRTRIPRTQTKRRQKPTRSTPLPQTTPRPHRLQLTQNELRLDIAEGDRDVAIAVRRPEPGCALVALRRRGASRLLLSGPVEHRSELQRVSEAV